MPIKYSLALTSNRMKINRANKACSYFPCHKNLEDCTFCYCPFYPCNDKSLGKAIYSLKLKKYIWSCQNCFRIHKRSVVDRIIRLIRESGADQFLKGERKNIK